MAEKVVSLHTGSFTHKIYKFIVRKRAVTANEIAEEFKGTPLKRSHINSYFIQLMKNNFIVKSTVKVQSDKRMCSRSYVYGIDEDAIKRKIESLNHRVDTDQLLVGIKGKIFEIFSNNARGLTLAELFYQLKDYPSLEEYNNWDYT